MSASALATPDATIRHLAQHITGNLRITRKFQYEPYLWEETKIFKGSARTDALVGGDLPLHHPKSMKLGGAATTRHLRGCPLLLASGSSFFTLKKSDEDSTQAALRFW